MDRGCLGSTHGTLWSVGVMRTSFCGWFGRVDSVVDPPFLPDIDVEGDALEGLPATRE